MLSKWDSKLLFLSGAKHEGLAKIVKYYFYNRNNKNLNANKKKQTSKRSYFIDDQLGMGERSVFNKIESTDLKKHEQLIMGYSNKILQHQVNLLGSGWVSLSYGGTDYKGFEGHSYNDRSNEPKPKKYIGDYEPINWNIDYVSGYEWSATDYFKDIKFGGKLGVDIKKPWELGRFYHLAQLSFAFNLTDQDKYLNEIINQFYDFTVNCPLCLGTQWGNAMEVGIRAINWIFCIDQIGSSNLSKQFKQDVNIFLTDHLDYILAELEWTTIARSNHYLTNLCAMLVILSKVKRTNDLEGLYYWAARELSAEIEFQFHSDGGNYEGSTGYHRLSSELVFIALNIIKNDEPVKPKAYRIFEKHNIFNLPHFHKDILNINKFSDLIDNIFGFMENINIKSQQMIQVGDMDSGRVLKLTPQFDNELSQEGQLNVEPVLALLDGSKSNFIEAKAFPVTMSVTKKKFNIKIQEEDINYLLSTEVAIKKNSQTYEWETELNLLQSLKFSSFPEFGLYIVESDYLYLSIRCGGIGQNGVGGHSHNDQLSINLRIGDKAYIQDPGSYIYTAHKEKRNAYRSVKAHFTPTMNQQEPSPITNNLFRLKQDSVAMCKYFDGNYFFGRYRVDGVEINRVIEIKRNKIKVTDYCSDDNKLDRLPLEGGYFLMPVKFSPGYGELEGE